VTYVRQSIGDIGRRALDLLLKQMKMPGKEREEVIISSRLIIRKSTAGMETNNKK
jgi:DNA-binding LacI/PurR family transcriptional regulator